MFKKIFAIMVSVVCTFSAIAYNINSNAIEFEHYEDIAINEEIGKLDERMLNSYADLIKAYRKSYYLRKGKESTDTAFPIFVYTDVTGDNIPELALGRYKLKINGFGNYILDYIYTWDNDKFVEVSSLMHNNSKDTHLSDLSKYQLVIDGFRESNESSFENIYNCYPMHHPKEVDKLVRAGILKFNDRCTTD